MYIRIQDKSHALVGIENNTISEAQTYNRATRREAASAFENMRSQVQTQLEDKPEPTIDEINAMIADVRKE